MKSNPFCFLLLLACFTFSFHPISAQTNVGGTFFSNQHWQLSGSPYTVTTDFQLAPGYLLTIDPGVQVHFSGNTEILIKGGISALGAQGNPIVFDGTGADNVLHFLDTDLGFTNMSYCIISGGNRAIFMEGSCSDFGTLENMSFANTKVQAYQAIGGQMDIIGSQFDNVELWNSVYSPNMGKLNFESSLFIDCHFKSVGDQGNFTPLEVHGSNLDNCHFEVNYFQDRGLLIEGDTLKNCFFHSNYGKGIIDNCYIKDSEFSNFGVTQQNQFFYDLSNSILVNTDFVGGTILGNMWSMSIGFDHCLIEKTANTVMALDDVDFNNCSILGVGTGTGVRATYLNAHQSLFKWHSIGVHFGHTYTPISLHLDECNIWGNSLYNAICDTTYGTNAQGTWWGTADSLTIFTKILDYYDNLLHGEIVLGNWPSVPDTNAPMSPPSGIGDTPGSGFHTITWDANLEGDLMGYRLYLGTTSGYLYGQSIDLGNVTSHQLPDSLYNQGFALTAYDHGVDGNHDIVEGHESGFSRLGGPFNAVETPMLQSDIDWQVFPNPAHDQIHVVVKGADQGLILTLYDLQGRVVMAQPTSTGGSLVDVSRLPAGMYILHGSAHGRSVVQRIVVE